MGVSIAYVLRNREIAQALTLYGAGLALLYWLRPAGTSFLWSAVSLLPLLLVGWLSFALDRLRPAPEIYQGRRTRPQRRFENQARAEMALLAAVMIGTPLVLAFTGSDPGLTISSFAPILAWVMVLKTIGWHNIPQTISHVFHGGASKSHIDEADASDFLRGLAISEGRYGVLEWKADVAIQPEGGVPSISGMITQIGDAQEGSERDVIHLSPQDGLALMVSVTGSGNPYELPRYAVLSMTLDLSDFSTHEKLRMTKVYRDAHLRLEQMCEG